MNWEIALKNKLKFKVTDTVRSNFRARWIGKIIFLSSRPTGSLDLATVIVFLDRNGRPLRKPITKVIDTGWLEKVENING